MFRAGLHCLPQAHRTIGTIEHGTVRVSPGFFNTAEDIDYFINSVRKIAAKAAPATFSREQLDTFEAGDFVSGYKIQRTAPCYVDEHKGRVIVSLPRNARGIAAVFELHFEGQLPRRGKNLYLFLREAPGDRGT